LWWEAPHVDHPGAAALFSVVKDNVKNISTIADPGCIKGKQIILDNGNLGSGEDQLKAEPRAMISGMDSAAAASHSPCPPADVTSVRTCPIPSRCREMIVGIWFGAGRPGAGGRRSGGWDE